MNKQSSDDSVGKIILSIFIAGLIAGIIFSIGIRFGTEPSEFGIALVVVDALCSTYENNDGLMMTNCNLIPGILIVTSVMVTVLLIIYHASRIGNFKVGLGIHFAGWGCGMYLILVYAV